MKRFNATMSVLVLGGLLTACGNAPDDGVSTSAFSDPSMGAQDSNGGGSDGYDGGSDGYDGSSDGYDGGSDGGPMDGPATFACAYEEVSRLACPGFNDAGDPQPHCDVIYADTLSEAQAECNDRTAAWTDCDSSGCCTDAWYQAVQVWEGSCEDGPPSTPDSQPDPGSSGGCQWTNDGECDEPEGTGLCPEGSDVADCSGGGGGGGTSYGACPCEGDDVCVGIDGTDGSFCSPPCDGAGSYCPPGPGSADAVCGLSTDTSGDPTNCVLVCEYDSDCPAGASCVAITGGAVCIF